MTQKLIAKCFSSVKSQRQIGLKATAVLIALASAFSVWADTHGEKKTTEPKGNLKAQIAASTVGQVNSISGTVVIEREGTPFAAKIGSPVTPMDVIETKKRSSAKLIMADRSVLIISSETRFQVKQYVQKKLDGRLIELNSGRLRATVEPASESETGNKASETVRTKTAATKEGVRGDSFEVKTSLAIVGVRGTEFEVTHSPTQTEVVVFSGEVNLTAVADPKSRVLIPKGFRGIVRKGQSNVIRNELTSEDLKKLEFPEALDPSGSGQK